MEITALALALITVWKLNPNAVDANKDLNIIKKRSISQVYVKLAKKIIAKVVIQMQQFVRPVRKDILKLITDVLRILIIALKWQI